MTKPKLIAVDWGTTRLRAYLVDGQGHVLDATRRRGHHGGAARRLSGHVAAACRALARAASRVAGRDGGHGRQPQWLGRGALRRVPHGYEEHRGPLAKVDLGDGLSGMIVPGLTTRDSAGVPDVMRGEETKLAGCGVSDGIVVSPAPTPSGSAWRAGRSRVSPPT